MAEINLVFQVCIAVLKALESVKHYMVPVLKNCFIQLCCTGVTIWLFCMVFYDAVLDITYSLDYTVLRNILEIMDILCTYSNIYALYYCSLSANVIELLIKACTVTDGCCNSGKSQWELDFIQQIFYTLSNF